jgi:hypothetical protein
MDANSQSALDAQNILRAHMEAKGPPEWALLYRIGQSAGLANFDHFDQYLPKLTNITAFLELLEFL